MTADDHGGIRMSTARLPIDGYDVLTAAGVLHFDHEPDEAEVSA